MPYFFACIKKAEEDLEAKLVPIIEKIVLKVLEEKLPKKAEDIVIETNLL